MACRLLLMTNNFSPSLAFLRRELSGNSVPGPVLSVAVSQTSKPASIHCRGLLKWLVSALVWISLNLGGTTWASLEAYDASIQEDAMGGLRPLISLTASVILTGSNRVAFDFGSNPGDATFEFILEGDPNANNSAYLAVGANADSNLRYDLYDNTGQLGFTQLGIKDYAFTPGVPCPVKPTHVAYAWNSTTHTMRLFLDGHLSGTCAGVSSSFGMPSGRGWLGANPQGGEVMVGTLHRLTIYSGLVSEDVILRHADAFKDVVRPPQILSLIAHPDTVFTPGSATLTWEVRDADTMTLNDTDVTTRSNLVVFPSATSTYTLIARNTAGSAKAQVTLQVNPAPIIERFASDRAYVAAGQSLTFSWQTRYATTLSISPGVGDVTSRTVAGAGSVQIQPESSATYLLTAFSEFGTNQTSAEIHVVKPADHLVISEFMADDQSTLPDEDGHFSGWIEIHNPTGDSVPLAGYYLTDDAGNPPRWALPATNLPAGGYQLVFASGKNRQQPGRPLHTNFQLNNDGEYLALVGPGPRVLHAFSPAFPAQRPDISYGILADDPALVRYMRVPTPGAANNEAPPPPLSVVFSHASGTFTGDFSLILTAPDPDSDIRFTTDGSAPGLNTGTRYQAPIQVSRTTHIRAVAILNGLVSGIAGASFIKLAPDLASYSSSLPLMVIENFGAGGIRQKGWNATGAGIKQVPRQTAVWATFAPENGRASMIQAPQMVALIGIRGRGAYSTEWRQKPYSVEAWDEEGEEVEVSPLDMPKHADWVLYFPDPEQNRDPALLFNTFAYELNRTMGRYAVRFRWVEAFINEDGGDLSLSDRRGVYAIIEKVARGKDRLDFQRLSTDGSTGGWLLNINRMDPEPDTGWPAANGATRPWFFHTAGPNRILQTEPNQAYHPVPGDDLPQQWNAFINFDNPNGYVIHPAQRAAIEGWFTQFENVLYNDRLWRDSTDGYRRYLDPLDFVDYFILNVLTRNGDGLLLSMFPWKGEDGKLRMGPGWDYNWSAYYISGGPTGALLHRSDQLWYARLFQDPDFMQLYIDRWCDLRRGPFSNATMNTIIDRQASEITPEKSLLNGMPNAAEWSRRLQQMKSWLNQRADWIDSNYLRPPAFNQNGGEAPDGFAVIVTGGGGTLYVTTDGADPRAPGGAVAGSARPYSSPLILRAPTLLKARLKNGASWSGLTSAFFSTPQDLTPLVFSEIMYNPVPAGVWESDDLEFLELKNVGAKPLDLSLFEFTMGIEFRFTNHTVLGPNQFFLLARNSAALAERYPGIHVNGTYTGKLNNGGENLRLSTPFGQTAIEITFGNNPPWPVMADGFGFSMVPVDAATVPNSNQGGDWRISSEPGGSPGGEDPGTLGLDGDGDRMFDWQEYIAGTDPADPHSLLKIDSVALTDANEVILTFQAIANKSYTVEYTDALPDATWSRLADVFAQPVNRNETVRDARTHPGRYYRLLTPAKP